ncbi:putative efflux pump antibiotic resistance protein [Botrytis fragariae]|uniref:Putative efflux pump antibiotic resistance protein n=1 Tax=Botrytis fragariae TaxID=1964551 RepID=A0A8H6AS89_9HELO|nr:putative efflux pump antibiotic resistance protein [Botrytis fragariae]KAF5872843.1 putative efflux pump antibiotic resistance protein [Botrytis fragariae]
MSETSQQQLPLQIFTNDNTTIVNSVNDHSKPLSKSKDSDSTATVQLNTFKDQQSNNLPHKKLMQVFPLLALAQFTAYLDQTSISAAVPSIGEALNLGPQLSWVATSYLMATTAVQLLNGRLSDIFGRKQLLLTSLGILATGNLICGFSNTPAMLFTFRVVSGLGVVPFQIIASDVTTLQQRGKYNGFIGLAVAFGSGLGPLLGGAMATKVSWRWTLWYDVPWLVILSIMLFTVLPSSKMASGTRSKLGMIDWIGVAMSVAAIVLLLVPLSQGGSTFAWNSSLVIAMLAIGAVTFAVFLAVEWKVAKLPIMPIHLFRNGLSCNILLVQNVLYGIVFWGNLFYMPIYLVNVRGYTAIMAGAIIMPMAGSQGLGSILSGLIISHTKRYNPVMVLGQWVWALLLIPQAFYSRTTPIWAICVVGFFQGLGTGFCFQPSLVALLAHSRRADRAVLNSLRNFLRTMGGTLGLTLASTILNNVLKTRLRGVVSSSVAETLTTSINQLDSLGLSAAQHNAVLDAYMASVRTVFILYAPLIGACALAALLVSDNGLEEKDTSVTLSPSTPALRS